MRELNSLVCPACEEGLTEDELERSLVCPHCSTNLKQPRFQDFLEYLMMQGIVEEIDFFDLQLYGDEIMTPFPSEFDDADTSPYEERGSKWTPYRDNMPEEDDAEMRDGEEDDEGDW